METGTALMRALVAATRCGCHVLNMSYGEAVDVPDDGEFTRLLDSLVYDHGILFVSSAGAALPVQPFFRCPGPHAVPMFSQATMAPRCRPLALLAEPPPARYQSPHLQLRV